MDEQPLYVMTESKKRAIIPKIITLITLAIIFYAAVLLNVALLDLGKGQASNIRGFALIIVTILVIIGIAISFLRDHHYRFFKDHISHGKKELRYLDIMQSQVKRSIWDKLFKTHALVLTKKFTIHHIPDTVDLKTYVNQMVSYSKKIV